MKKLINTLVITLVKIVLEIARIALNALISLIVALLRVTSHIVLEIAKLPFIILFGKKPKRGRPKKNSHKLHL